jgi:hypothetical protein
MLILKYVELAKGAVGMRLDHFAIPVENPINAAAWLRDLFPTNTFKTLHEDQEWVFLEMKGHKLAFVKEGVHPPHFAMHINTPEQLRAIAKRYNKEVLQEREDTLNFYLTGPENLCVEFIAYLRDFDVE